MVIEKVGVPEQARAGRGILLISGSQCLSQPLGQLQPRKQIEHERQVLENFLVETIEIAAVYNGFQLWEIVTQQSYLTAVCTCHRVGTKVDFCLPTNKFLPCVQARRGACDCQFCGPHLSSDSL